MVEGGQNDAGGDQADHVRDDADVEVQVHFALQTGRGQRERGEK